MSEQKFVQLSGPIGGSLAVMGATQQQLIDVGPLSGDGLVLSASELADRLVELPPECGGREVVAALRTMEPDTRLRLTPDGPATLAAADPITPDNITEGFYWVRSKTWPRVLNVMSVIRHYDAFHFAVPFLDDDMRGDGIEETFASYDFIARIPEPV